MMDLKTSFSLRLVMILLAVTVASIAITPYAEAKDSTSGIVVGVDTDSNGNLTQFAISDSSGNITTFELEASTEFGLENQAGDRWVSTLSAGAAEAARRLEDHRGRFAAITVVHENGVAFSVVEREEGKLETNLGYMFAVFAITWALFFAYILYMGRKQRVLQHEITRLKNSK
jgi:CcmD family protein